MGWCSGTEVFDDIGNYVLNSDLTIEQQTNVMKAVAEAMEYHDWDCQNESGHFDDPVIQDVFRQLHPDWFDEDGD